MSGPVPPSLGFFSRFPRPLSDSVDPNSAVGVAVAEIEIGDDAQLKVNRRALFVPGPQMGLPGDGYNLFRNISDALGRIEDGSTSEINWTKKLNYGRMRTAASLSLGHLPGQTDEQPVLLAIRIARKNNAAVNKKRGIRFATDGVPFSGGNDDAEKYLFSPRHYHDGKLLDHEVYPQRPDSGNDTGPCIVAAMIVKTKPGIYYNASFNIYLEVATKLGNYEAVTPVIFDPEIPHPPAGGGIPLWP